MNKHDFQNVLRDLFEIHAAVRVDCFERIIWEFSEIPAGNEEVRRLPAYISGEELIVFCSCRKTFPQNIVYVQGKGEVMLSRYALQQTEMTLIGEKNEPNQSVDEKKI